MFCVEFGYACPCQLMSLESAQCFLFVLWVVLNLFTQIWVNSIRDVLSWWCHARPLALRDVSPGELSFAGAAFWRRMLYLLQNAISRSWLWRVCVFWRRIILSFAELSFAGAALWRRMTCLLQNCHLQDLVLGAGWLVFCRIVISRSCSLAQDDLFSAGLSISGAVLWRRTTCLL